MCQLQPVNMGFTTEKFPPGTHMCLIYNSDKERRMIISRFLESGLLEGERVGYFADTMTPDEVRTWLAGLDIELAEKEEKGQFLCSQAIDTYCPSSSFVPDEMLDTLRSSFTRAIDDGYPGLRVSGEMSWALKGIPGSNRLMEYEAKVNIAFRTHPIIAICQYDANRFDGATILDVLKVHPMMVVQGQIVRNPYYVKPEEFLASYTASL